MGLIDEFANAIAEREAEQKARTEAAKRRKNFYLSRAWRALRYRALRENADRHGGTITCDVCGCTSPPFHVDHIEPRSKNPSRELDPTNLQILCEACNLGKGNSDSRDWRSPAAATGRPSDATTNFQTASKLESRSDA